MDISVFLCGDIVISSSKHEIVDESLKKTINSSDISVCNFEAPVESLGKPISKAGPHVFQVKDAPKRLKEIGFTHLSLANNHIYDFGDVGLATTIDDATKVGLKTFGAGKKMIEAYTPIIENINGTNIGLFSLAEAEFGCLLNDSNRGGYAYVNHNDIEKKIINIKKDVDFLVIIIHAGVEEVDLPLPEWRERYKKLCDVGADVIIGHHPHVPQGWELYNNKPIFYSLGNFHFDWGIDNKDFGYSVVLKLEKNKNIDFDIITHKKIEGITTVINNEEFNDRIKQLCNKLNENYDNEVESLINELYISRYQRYIECAVRSYSSNMSFYKKMKRIIFSVLCRKKELKKRELLMHHNTMIDSHHYVIKRFLKTKWEKLINQ